jgi:hypothetical protein
LLFFLNIGAVVGDNKQKQITGRVLIDNKDEYSVTAEWVKTRKGNIFSITFGIYWLLRYSLNHEF